MIDPKRNQRLWQACGWKVLNDKGPKYLHLWSDPDGDAVTLPSPSDLSFPGYLQRDALKKVREKWPAGVWITIYTREGEEACVIRSGFEMIALCKAPTLSEAMFLAFEQALLGPQDSQQAG